MCMFRRSLFVLLSFFFWFGNCVVCPSIYGFLTLSPNGRRSHFDFLNMIKFRYRQACDLRVGRFLGSIINFLAVLLHLVLFILSYFIFRIFPTTLSTKFFSNFERRNVIFHTFATKEMKRANST